MGSSAMAISFVNGFLCTCSCDVAKAKQGQDPHPGAHPAKVEAQGTPRTGHPSVTFGGSLRGLSSGVSAPGALDATDPSSAAAVASVSGTKPAETARPL